MGLSDSVLRISVLLVPKGKDEALSLTVSSGWGSFTSVDPRRRTFPHPPGFPTKKTTPDERGRLRTPSLLLVPSFVVLFVLLRRSYYPVAEKGELGFAVEVHFALKSDSQWRFPVVLTAFHDL